MKKLETTCWARVHISKRSFTFAGVSYSMHTYRTGDIEDEEVEADIDQLQESTNDSHYVKKDFSLISYQSMNEMTSRIIAVG